MFPKLEPQFRRGILKTYSGCSQTREQGLQDVYNQQRASSDKLLSGSRLWKLSASQGHEDSVWTEILFTPKLLECEELETPSSPVPVLQPCHQLLPGGTSGHLHHKPSCPSGHGTAPASPRLLCVCSFLFSLTGLNFWLSSSFVVSRG